MILQDIFKSDPLPRSTMEIIARNVVELGKQVERLNEVTAQFTRDIQGIEHRVNLLERELESQ